MYYKQSCQILERIESAENILVNIHKNPDLDSISSTCSLVRSFNRLGKKITIVASQPIESPLLIFTETNQIKRISYTTYDFSKYDLLIVVDSSSYDRVTGSKNIPLPEIPTIVIDHHHFNGIEGMVKLVDTKASATTEIIYRLLKDCKKQIDKDLATRLYCGIVGDTVFFKYLENPIETLKIAADLLRMGADHQYLVDRVYDNMDFNFVKLMGFFLEKMEITKSKSGKKFAWAAVSHEQFMKFGGVKGAREAVADSFFRSIKGVDFGLAMVESTRGVLSISFRSKPKIDVSVMAKILGGGGHTNAAGATIVGTFDKSVKNTLEKIKNNY